jgi:acyl carrier protein
VTAGHAPEATTEPTETLAGVWRDLLAIDDVHPDTHFFEAGGHSMLAARMMRRVGKKLGVDLPVDLVYDHPTLGALSEAVGKALAVLGEASAPPVPTGATEGSLSLQQRELMRIESMVGPSPLNNVVVPLSVAPAPDLQALRAAVRGLVRRHGTLRTAFLGEAEGDWRQVVHPPSAADGTDVEVVDLTCTAVDRWEQAARQAVLAVYKEPFDLASGRMLRAQLILGPGERHVLALHSHHLCVDGVSQAVLLEDLADGYADAAREEPTDGVSYLDFVGWQADRWPDLLRDSRAHWTDALGTLAIAQAGRDAPDGPRVAPLQRASAVVPRPTAAVSPTPGAASPATSGALTDFHVVAAAAATAVDSVSGVVGVGLLMENRPHEELERVVGPMATSGLVTVETGEGRDLGEVAEDVRARVLAAQRWSELPFELLVDEPARDLHIDPGTLTDVVVSAAQAPIRRTVGDVTFASLPDDGEPLLRVQPAGPPTVFVEPLEAGLRLVVESNAPGRPARTFLDRVVERLGSVSGNGGEGGPS